MVIHIVSHLQLPRLEPLTTMDNHLTIPPVSPPLILYHGTPLPLPLIRNPTRHPTSAFVQCGHDSMYIGLLCHE
jgi:hypothetical protein